MVKAIQPKLIVAIGFAALDFFGGGVEAATSAKGRVLTKVGKIAGRDAVGVLHLSGAYISTLDRETIAHHIRQRWPECFGA
jgi:uracil-DNA glycosylase